MQFKQGISRLKIQRGARVFFNHCPLLTGWLRDEMQLRVKGIVVHHFHDDCLSGLAAFHQADTPSYANKQTITLAGSSEFPLPQHGFSKSMELAFGSGKVINRYFGAGHTTDNIVSYVPGEKVLFGGCMIKELGTGKGNLNDADTLAWPVTVSQGKQAYPDLKIIIPGHGNTGGTGLLDYTIEMFER